jgi:DNA-directed RNA polymerase subunit RPC12/RpoP
MPKDPFRPTGKRNALIAAGCVVAAAVIIAGGAFAYSQLTKPAEPSHTTHSTATVQQKEDGKVSVKVNCDGWNADTSTPIVVSVYSGDVKDTLTSTDENIVAPDPLFTKDVEAGVETDLDDIKDNGTYTIAVTGSPILDDGTIFDLPEPQVVDFDTAKGASVEITLIAKAADQVTEADIAAAQAAAVASGADAEKVSAKASNATNKAASAQGGTVASGNNNQQGSNTGSSTGNTTQTHQHNWVPQTTTAHHDAVYKTETSYIHHDAVYETRTVSVCVTCGAENPSLQHSKNHALNGQSDQVREVEKKVLVKNAYDEPVTKQVLVSAAYDETVTTGYKCSDCGATKSN